MDFGAFLVRAVLQRVSSASVTVDGVVLGAIGIGADGNDAAGAETRLGLLILLGVEQGDSEKDSTYLAQKSVDLRIFPDEEGKINKSILDVGGAILVISQFTLIADWRKGRRPSFIRAAAPAIGNELYLHFIGELRRLGVTVETGQFGADMKVSLVNDGPVTMILENQFASTSPVSA
ncbi:MAG TPA: D-aminoacyl-tRNA deacylase [Oculatellaceae cyanobacterium]